MKTPSQDFGTEAEHHAKDFLIKKGYTILEQNFKNRFGEIDLIAKKDDRLIFVEVKALRSKQDFIPMDHFNHRKRQKLLLLGKAYLTRFSSEVAAQFDLISITKTGTKLETEHFEDVITESVF